MTRLTVDPGGRQADQLHTKNEAEIAILVSDRCQKQGLGIELLRRTVQIARDEQLL